MKARQENKDKVLLMQLTNSHPQQGATILSCKEEKAVKYNYIYLLKFQ